MDGLQETLNKINTEIPVLVERQNINATAIRDLNERSRPHGP